MSTENATNQRTERSNHGYDAIERFVCVMDDVTELSLLAMCYCLRQSYLNHIHGSCVYSLLHT